MIVPIVLAPCHIVTAFRGVLYGDRPRICRVLFRRHRVFYQPLKAVTRSFYNVRGLMASGAKGRESIKVSTRSLVPRAVNVRRVRDRVNVPFLTYCLPRRDDLVDAYRVAVNVRVIFVSKGAAYSMFIRDPNIPVISVSKQDGTRNNRNLNNHNVSNDCTHLRDLRINFKVRRAKVTRRALN